MDFGPSAHDYAKHRQTFPDSFFERVPLNGDVLDLGSGTGAVARGYAARGAKVIATDISRAMLAEANDLPHRVVARAEECRRVLKPGGRIVIAHFNYLPFPGSAAEATRSPDSRAKPRLGLLRYQPHAGPVGRSPARRRFCRALVARL